MMIRKSLSFLAAAAVLAACSAQPVPAESIISGAGSTFVTPICSQWASDYGKVSGVKLNYQSIGSGGGVKAIKDKTVDFGASDAPLTEKALADNGGLVQFPIVMGGVVPVVNIKGVEAGKLKLSGAVLADIYLGKIKNWNDPALKALNDGVALPDLPIAVVHRSDGSGTTWIYTNYLDKVSPDWHTKVGTNTAVEWPVGTGGKGNEGVSANVLQINGAIGYVELAYALEHKMTYLQLQNKAGKFVQPTLDAFAAAAANADWKNAPSYYVVLTDQPGDASWPITGATFALVYKDQKNPETAKNVLKFFDWCYKNGQETAKQKNYVPMPDSVVKMVEETWAKDVTSGGKPLWP